MHANKLLFTIVLFILFTGIAFAQEKAGGFVPAIFWTADSDIGVLLTAPAEMEIIDTKGVKHGKILAAEPVFGAYVSPDGKKLVYTTSSGLQFLKIETRETFLLASGACDYLRWSSDGSSFVFSRFIKNGGGGSNAFNIKLFWADGDGKNVKQVYP